jgi:predicted lipid-binding transport protein (Tim44 family)
MMGGMMGGKGGMMGGKMSGMMEHMMGKQGMGRHGMPRMDELMELGPEKAKAYLDLLVKHRKQALDIRAQALLVEMELLSAMDAESFDQNKAAQLSQQLSDLTAQAVKNRMDLVIALRAAGLPYKTICAMGHGMHKADDDSPHHGGKGMGSGMMMGDNPGQANSDDGKEHQHN